MNANAVEWNEFAQLEEADACRLAMLLAMTASLDVEKKLIAQFGAHGARGAVTVISGFDMGSQNNTIRNIINMCLNKGLIEKKFEHVHPVAHAVLEATECTRATMAVGQNYCFKGRPCVKSPRSPSACTAIWACTRSPATKQSAWACRFWASKNRPPPAAPAQTLCTSREKRHFIQSERRNVL